MLTIERIRELQAERPAEAEPTRNDEEAVNATRDLVEALKPWEDLDEDNGPLPHCKPTMSVGGNRAWFANVDAVLFHLVRFVKQADKKPSQGPFVLSASLDNAFSELDVAIEKMAHIDTPGFEDWASEVEAAIRRLRDIAQAAGKKE